jgi:hypothetical protein
MTIYAENAPLAPVVLSIAFVIGIALWATRTKSRLP